MVQWLYHNLYFLEADFLGGKNLQNQFSVPQLLSRMGNGNFFCRESFPDTLTLKVNRIFPLIPMPAFGETHQPVYNRSVTDLFNCVTQSELHCSPSLSTHVEGYHGLCFSYLFVPEGLRNDILTALDEIHITYTEKPEWLWHWYHSLTAEMEGERRVYVQKKILCLKILRIIYTLNINFYLYLSVRV